MIPRVPFVTFRLSIPTLAVLAQIYLFVRARKVILSSRRSDPFKSRAVVLLGTVIVLLFAMNGYILSRPIPWVDPPMAASSLLFYLPAIWGFGSILSALLLCLAQASRALVRVVLRLYHGLAGEKTPVSCDPDRRRFLQAGAVGLAAAPFILSGYGAVYASKAYEVEELTLPFGRSIRVVQLTDIHAGIYMTRQDMRRYSDQVIALRPDLFVLTGDFISNSLLFLPGCLEEMARVSARYGTFATLGNHERWYCRPGDLRAIFRKYEIPVLVNRHQVIQTEQGPFAVAGIDDLSTGHPDLTGALRGLHPATPVLLLSHRPEVFPQAAARGIPLTLAGHYHGGQIKLRLPGLDISLAHLRTPYPQGLYRMGTSRLYVSRGIGTTFTPVRLNATPEVTLFHLT